MINRFPRIHEFYRRTSVFFKLWSVMAPHLLHLWRRGVSPLQTIKNAWDFSNPESEIWKDAKSSIQKELEEATSVKVLVKEDHNEQT